MMKHLILMRHAKAEKDAPSGEDYDRPLAARGLEEATSVAEALKAYGLKPDFAIVSPACRTRQTFDQVCGVFGDIPVVMDKAFYNAGAQALRSAVEANEEAGACILVVAHNPGIQYLAADYMFEGAASAVALDKVRGGFPTATAAVFEVDAAGRPLYDGLYLAKDVLGA